MENLKTLFNASFVHSFLFILMHGADNSGGHTKSIITQLYVNGYLSTCHIIDKYSLYSSLTAETFVNIYVGMCQLSGFPLRPVFQPKWRTEASTISIQWHMFIIKIEHNVNSIQDRSFLKIQSIKRKKEKSVRPTVGISWVWIPTMPHTFLAWSQGTKVGCALG